MAEFGFFVRGYKKRESEGSKGEEIRFRNEIQLKKGGEEGERGLEENGRWSI